MRVSLRNNKGFSLIELMVVVAIIGILAAIAVPNYQRFTSKSKQAEAKANLSAVYSAMRAFHSEWQTYITRFQVNGYAPTGLLRYQHGFLTEFTTLPTGYPSALPPGQSSTLAFCSQGAAMAGPWTNNCNVQIVPVNPGALTASTGGATGTFTASAVGDIDGDPMIDAWTINENKSVQLVVGRDDVVN